MMLRRVNDMDILCGLLLDAIVLWAIVGAIYDKLRSINDDIQYALFKLDRIEDLTNESLGENEDTKAYNQGLEVAMEIIKEYCEEN